MKKKQNNTIVYVVGAVLVIGAFALFLFGGGNKNEDAKNNVGFSTGVLAAAEKDYDFGTIKMGDGVVKKQFELKNESQEPVMINKVYTSCACTTAYVIDSSGKRYGKFGMPGHSGLRKTADVEVQPGGSVMVEAVYDPAFHGPSGVGLAQRSIYLETNSAKSPKVEFRIQAMVTR